MEKKTETNLYDPEEERQSLSKYIPLHLNPSSMQEVCHMNLV